MGQPRIWRFKWVYTGNHLYSKSRNRKQKSVVGCGGVYTFKIGMSVIKPYSLQTFLYKSRHCSLLARLGRRLSRTINCQRRPNHSRSRGETIYISKWHERTILWNDDIFLSNESLQDPHSHHTNCIRINPDKLFENHETR